MTPPPTRSRLVACLTLAASVPLILVGACSPGSKTDASAATTGAAPSTSAAASTASAEPPAERGGDAILPVYPLDTGPPDPLAQRYCEAIHLLPARRAAECCDGVAVSAAPFAQQCVRTLTYALGHHAAALAPEDVDRCIDAVTRSTAGCDWITPHNPPLPPVCLGIVKGLLAQKAQCRSSLECGDGLRCQGLSSVDYGVCAPPKPAGVSCNLASDMLAVFTRQDEVGRAHPECEGQCFRTTCRDALAPGAACTGDQFCGAKQRCLDGKCASAGLPAAGEACAGTCAYGARCVKGKCAAPRAEGDACEVSAECRGECVRGDGGSAGKCQKACPFFGVPPTPTAKPTVKPRGVAPKPR